MRQAVVMVSWEHSAMGAVLAALWPHSLTQQDVFEPLGFAGIVLVLTGVCAPGDPVTSEKASEVCRL